MVSRRSEVPAPRFEPGSPGVARGLQSPRVVHPHLERQFPTTWTAGRLLLDAKPELPAYDAVTTWAPAESVAVVRAAWNDAPTLASGAWPSGMPSAKK